MDTVARDLNRRIPSEGREMPSPNQVPIPGTMLSPDECRQRPAPLREGGSDRPSGRRDQRGGRAARVAKAFLKSGLTVLALVVAGLAATVIWQYYVTAPWTRDGRVRVQVASIAPQVSGQILELRVVDNQYVRKGDVLYVIDPFDYKVAIMSAQAELENRAADLQVKQAQSARRASLSTNTTTEEEKQQFAGTARIAEAAYAAAQAQLAQAKVNLERTSVRSSVNGYVTNLQLRIGDYATAGTTDISVVDADSYWIDGYFEETKMAHIRLGYKAQARLMGYDQSIEGRVESIARGIANSNVSPSTQGLPDVDPVYSWVRLAQRTPVQIRIEHLPEGVPLIAGMTATVTVDDPTAGNESRFRLAVNGLAERLRHLIGGEPFTATKANATTGVAGAQPVSSVPAPEAETSPTSNDAVPQLPLSLDKPIMPGGAIEVRPKPLADDRK